MSNIIIQSKGLGKSYRDGHHRIEVLKEINFSIASGQSVAIVGSSGSGKSTLLHLLAGLDEPTHGKVYWKGQDITRLSEKNKCQLRNSELGFIYQFHHLLPEFNALENVAMPLLIRGEIAKQAAKIAKELLHQVGLEKRVFHKIAELSGGERQRVAIARALVTRPSCVLADEPTGNLDAQTASQVLNVMFQLQETFSTSLIMVTHDREIARRLQMRYLLLDGQLNSL